MHLTLRSLPGERFPCCCHHCHTKHALRQGVSEDDTSRLGLGLALAWIGLASAPLCWGEMPWVRAGGGVGGAADQILHRS